MAESEVCPVCSGEMMSLDIPDKNLFHCTECGELGQLLESGVVSRLDPMLEKNRLGDDRVRAAISTPHITSAENLLGKVENLKRSNDMTMAEFSGGFRVVLARAENRISAVIADLAEDALVNERASRHREILEEARDCLVESARTRGIDDGSSSTKSAEG
jgi:hypothetical protein